MEVCKPMMLLWLWMVGVADGTQPEQTLRARRTCTWGSMPSGVHQRRPCVAVQVVFFSFARHLVQHPERPDTMQDE